MTREELINEDWGKEYSKLADLYAKKCKEVRELKDKNKQIREHIVNQCIFIVRRNSSNGYRDIDGDWVEPYCNTRDVIDEMEQLKEQK